MEKFVNKKINWGYEAAFILTNVLKGTRSNYENSPEFLDKEIDKRFLRIKEFNQRLYDELKDDLKDEVIQNDNFLRDIIVLVKSPQISGAILQQFALIDTYLKNGKYTKVEAKRIFFERATLNLDLIDVDPDYRINNLEDYYRFIKEMGVDQDISSILLDFYFEFEEKSKLLSDFINDVAKKVKKRAKKIEDIIKYYEEALNIDDIEKIIGRQQLDIKNRAITLTGYNSFSFFYFNDGVVSNSYFGIFIKDMILNVKKEDKVKNRVSRLKAMADINRFTILKMAREKPVYLQELSRELDIKPSTLSHHIQTLANERLLKIDVEIDNKRIFYSVDKETIEKTIEDLKELIK